MVNKIAENTNKRGVVLLKGTLISFILTLILVFIFSIILTYTNTPESTIFPVLVFITGISILLRKFNKYNKNE